MFESRTLETLALKLSFIRCKVGVNKSMPLCDTCIMLDRVSYESDTETKKEQKEYVRVAVLVHKALYSYQIGQTLFQ
jgi:hypothetical protein